ncbi:hypothetical protein DB346_09385 [Verrucomicrobia bacterium LW23]|nr:hypothetical protein DB346_09385 [Verrucomicrobia bacterium LW23]
MVEVVLALGMISTSAVVLMGVLATGLQYLRAEMDMTIQARIAQSILTHAQQTSFTNLGSLEGTYYFNRDGIPDTSPDSPYKVKVLAPTPSTEVPGGASISGVATISLEIQSTATIGKPRRWNVYVADTGL